MRIALPILIGLLVVAACPAFAVNTGDQPLPFTMALLPGAGSMNDLPIRVNDFGLRADTTWYGSFTENNGEYYAIAYANRADACWTFDRGIGPAPGRAEVIPNGEGWSVTDLTVNLAEYWRVIDASLDLGTGVPAPIIAGSRSLWCGADDDQSNDLCWECDAGYANDWCQRVWSEPLAYNGAGSVTLQCLYYSKSEPCFDGTQVYLRKADTSELMLNPYTPGECANNLEYTGGTWTDSIGHYTTPATYTRAITQTEIGVAQEIRIIFEFKSDGGWSDEDCDYATIWSGVGIDNVTINGGGIAKSYNFEDGIEPWDPQTCAAIGTYVDIVDVSPYPIQDPCVCRLENNVMEMHAAVDPEQANHPVGQNIEVFGPMCWFPNTDLKTIFMEFDMYAEMPLANGVLHRPSWKYYPWVCEETGAIGWSPRIGQDSWNYMGDDPVCGRWRYGGTEIDQGVSIPADAQAVIPMIQLLGSCEAFAVEECSNVTNFTPLYDNITVATTEGVCAPVVDFDTGTLYQDVGSYPSTKFDPLAPGPANVTADVYMDTQTRPDYCGDSLVIAGPNPGSDPNSRWAAKMYWRVKKASTFQKYYPRYRVWRDRVADGNDIDNPDSPVFTSAVMDSCQIGYVVLRNKFLSCFKEGDDDFVGEGQPENEMIWDDVVLPGTEIEYFVAAYYTTTPGCVYTQPDTAGGFFREFEVLPGIRTVKTDDFYAYHPATLYIDAWNQGAQNLIEAALKSWLGPPFPQSVPPDFCTTTVGCKIPKYRNWDRYDVWDASSNWNAPMRRGTVGMSNNGMTLDQILGYRTILLNTGSYGAGGMQDEDFLLFRGWLESSACQANANRQYFHMNGDKCGELLNNPGGDDNIYAPPFFSEVLGAYLYCQGFNGYNDDPNCQPQNWQYCVDSKWTDAASGFCENFDVVAYGSYCPNLFGFNVYQPIGETSFGNRYYDASLDPGAPFKTADYLQILNTNDEPNSDNYRTAVDGVNWQRMTRKVAGGEPPDGYCPRDEASVIQAIWSEISLGMTWGYYPTGTPPPPPPLTALCLGTPEPGRIPLLTSVKDLATCQLTWNLPADVDEGDLTFRVNRLYQNRPNPFNPTTEIRFSLAQAGQVEVAIYDVNGRLVKTLVNGKKEAGLHSAVWDGTNDRGNKVGSGVYWSKMKTASYISNKQMVILK